MLTTEQLHLLRRSFAGIETNSQVAALVFYRRLFELDPSLRALFTGDIEAQAAKLMDMLGWSIAMLDRPDDLTSALEDLGARHVGYGVREAHYATVGTALIDMLREALGEDIRPATLEAWQSLYDLIAESMQRGAARLALRS